MVAGTDLKLGIGRKIDMSVPSEEQNAGDAVAKEDTEKSEMRPEEMHSIFCRSKYSLRDSLAAERSNFNK